MPRIRAVALRKGCKRLCLPLLRINVLQRRRTDGVFRLHTRKGSSVSVCEAASSVHGAVLTLNRSRAYKRRGLCNARVQSALLTGGFETRNKMESITAALSRRRRPSRCESRVSLALSIPSFPFSRLCATVANSRRKSKDESRQKKSHCQSWSDVRAAGGRSFFIRLSDPLPRNPSQPLVTL